MDRTAMAHEGLVTVLPFRTLQFLAYEPPNRQAGLTRGAPQPFSQFLWQTNCNCITHEHYCNTYLYTCFTLN